MEVPMEVDSEDTINRKRNKRLILVMIGLLAAAAIAIGSMAFLTLLRYLRQYLRLYSHH